MTVPSQTSRDQQSGNGSTTEFTVPFRVLEAEHLRVLRTVGSITTELELNSNYTVDNVDEQNTTVNFLTPPANGAILTFLRSIPVTQETDYVPNDPFPAESHERALDKLTMILQQFSEVLDRALIRDPVLNLWDAQGHRIINVGDAIDPMDAVNLRTLLLYLGNFEGTGLNVAPKYWEVDGDGVQTEFMIPDADVDDPTFYDVLVGGVMQEPGIDYVIVVPADPAESTIVFTEAPPAGVDSWVVLRGYAKPFSGGGGGDGGSVAPEVVPVTDDTVLDRTWANKLIVIDEAVDITLTVRENTGDINLDWRAGEFFMVLQRGPGKVLLAAEGAGLIVPPADFENETRAQGSIISCSCVNAVTSEFASAGDLLRTAVEPVRQVIRLIDRSVLIGTAIATGTGKDTFIMPFDFQLDEVVDRGLYAALSVAQASGSTLTVDVNVDGTSILSTKLTVDNTEKTSFTAVTPAVYDTTFATTNNRIIPAGAEVSIDVDQVGTGARGLSVYLRGVRAN